MYELVHINERCHYIDCPAKVGIVENGDGSVCLIDGGSDKDAAKKILRHLDAQGWRLAAIYNTHSHADHIGGNRLLRERTGCKIWAPDAECAFVCNPVLEPTLLWGGFPLRDLRHKFLQAEPSAAEPFSAAPASTLLVPLPLPGHSPGMVGFRAPGNVVFLADALFSTDTLDKYGMFFVHDVTAFLQTLDMIAALKADVFVPAHAPVCGDIALLARRNAEKVHEIADRILGLCTAPTPFEGILQGLFTAFGLSMTTQQYVLVGSTLRSYLSWLRDENLLEFLCDNNRMLWHRLG